MRCSPGDQVIVIVPILLEHKPSGEMLTAIRVGTPATVVKFDRGHWLLDAPIHVNAAFPSGEVARGRFTHLADKVLLPIRPSDIQEDISDVRDLEAA